MIPKGYCYTSLSKFHAPLPSQPLLAPRRYGSRHSGNDLESRAPSWWNTEGQKAGATLAGPGAEYGLDASVIAPPAMRHPASFPRFVALAVGSTKSPRLESPS